MAISLTGNFITFGTPNSYFAENNTVYKLSDVVSPAEANFVYGETFQVVETWRTLLPVAPSAKLDYDLRWSPPEILIGTWKLPVFKAGLGGTTSMRGFIRDIDLFLTTVRTFRVRRPVSQVSYWGEIFIRDNNFTLTNSTTFIPGGISLSSSTIPSNSGAVLKGSLQQSQGGLTDVLTFSPTFENVGLYLNGGIVPTIWTYDARLANPAIIGGYSLQ